MNPVNNDYWVAHFQQNNERFEESLRAQGEILKDLEHTADAFEKLDNEFGGSVDQVGEEVERQEAAVQAKLRSSVKSLVRLYCDKDGDRRVDFGDELTDTMELLKTVLNTTN